LAGPGEEEKILKILGFFLPEQVFPLGGFLWDIVLASCIKRAHHLDTADKNEDKFQ
jgi:hypothetical protein